MQANGRRPIQKQSGAVLVLITLGMFALLGMTALVLAWFAGRLAARRYVRADIVTLVGR